MAVKMLVVLLASSLVLLTQSVTLAPRGDGGQKLPPPPSDDLLQEEIPPQDLPVEFLITNPAGGKLEGFGIPVLVHGEPQVWSSISITPRGRRPDCSGPGCTRGPPRFRLDEFPPARPSATNVGNLCSENREKLSYGPWNLPQTGFSHLSRQGDALNNLEAKVAECCQMTENEKLACSQKAWENTLNQYCKQEFMVKTRPHICCKKPKGDPRFTCFADLAPYPAYDKEIQLVNLAQVTPALVNTLCGQFTLLTKQKNIPALVQNITQSCCALQDSEKTQCAEEVKSQFIATLCSSMKSTWKDPKKCCSQVESAARSDCFNLNYLNNVSLASAVSAARPTEPSV